MDISLTIAETAREKFGISALKPFQILVMHRILEQEESETPESQLVILPTGTGKSICFLIPAFLNKGKTVIVYPLLALMNDQVNVLKRANIDCVCLKGGQTYKQRSQIFRKLKDGVKIVVTNPETLVQKKILESLSQFEIGLFVCDEAHVIAQWGREFRPSYRMLKRCIKVLNPHQVLAFTATADETVVNEIEEYLFPSSPVIVRGDADRENIFYSAFRAPNNLIGVRTLLKEVKRPAIVFCGTRNETYSLCVKTKAAARDIPMRYYHAGLSKAEREKVEEWFMKSEDGVLFCTSAYGMGVSKNNVRTVIHSYLPSSVLEYLQESGRAGRDMEPAWAYVVLSASLTDSSLEKNRVGSVFNGKKCRRIELLRNLGQDKDECTGCDVCTGTVEDRMRGSTVIVELIKSRPLRYTFADIAWLLGDERDFRFVREGFEFDRWYRVLSGMDRCEIEETCKALTCDEQHDNRPLQKMNLFGRKGLLYAKKSD